MYQPDVVSIGNMLVEVMRTELDQPLYAPGAFAGPFPERRYAHLHRLGGARLGHRAGFIGAIGADDFGRCLLDRFARDNVDPSQVVTLEGQTTGVAFVAYFTGGSRKFIFHWRHAAAGNLGPEHVDPDYVGGARWLHITGCNLAVSPSSREACYAALRSAAPTARVSFDANVRPELLTVEEIRELCEPVLARADVVLPSLGEATMLTGRKRPTRRAVGAGRTRAKSSC